MKNLMIAKRLALVFVTLSLSACDPEQFAGALGKAEGRAYRDCISSGSGTVDLASGHRQEASAQVGPELQVACKAGARIGRESIFSCYTKWDFELSEHHENECAQDLARDAQTRCSRKLMASILRQHPQSKMPEELLAVHCLSAVHGVATALKNL